MEKLGKNRGRLVGDLTRLPDDNLAWATGLRENRVRPRDVELRKDAECIHWEKSAKELGEKGERYGTSRKSGIRKGIRKEENNFILNPELQNSREEGGQGSPSRQERNQRNPAHGHASSKETNSPKYQKKTRKGKKQLSIIDEASDFRCANDSCAKRTGT